MTTIYQTRAAELLPAVRRMSRREFLAYAHGASEFDKGALEVLLRKQYVDYLNRQDYSKPSVRPADDGPSVDELERLFGVPAEFTPAELADQAQVERALALPAKADLDLAELTDDFRDAMLDALPGEISVGRAWRGRPSGPFESAMAELSDREQAGEA